MGFYWLYWASLAQLLHTHPRGLWVCYQSPTLFACIALGLSRPILTFFSYHTLPRGLLFAISLFLGSFEPICFLKAHLFISWTCDPLFLLLGLNGFCSLYFADFFSVCVAGWASSLSFGFHKKKTLNNGLMVRTRANVTSIVHSNPPLHTSKLPVVSVIVVKT